MTDSLEIWGPDGRSVVVLSGATVTIGAAASCDVALSNDATVSRLHVVLERLGARWLARDAGSRNGTFLNGHRLVTERVLHDGDELRAGRTRLVFGSSEDAARGARTEADVAPPMLTEREREVLVCLCRPLTHQTLFCEPASIRQVAAALFVSEAAVKAHLSRLYDKFGIHDGGDRRRVRLANEALERGAISLADLQG
ncbi:MAG TPA: FHA domain-containing protein [Acidimicrobiales bacterium]|nr:FHA domain-containing protein [Acidimicrobiales bacterium]